MKLLFTVLVISLSLTSFEMKAQTANDKLKEVTITKKDQSTFKTGIDLDQLFKKGKLISRDSVFRKSGLAAVYSIQVDSNIYLLKSIRNKKDSVAILSRAVEGKVSVYTPPLESGLEGLFVEKEDATYEMLVKVVESDGRKFHKNEFRGFLQVFFSDCPDITKEMVDRTALSELSIMKIVSRYNKSCGFEKANRANVYKAKFHYGLQLEALHYNSTKGAYQNYFEGDRPATGFGFGVYARLDFARKKSAFLISELTFNKISGGGDISYYVNVPTYQILSEHHNFDITELRNTYSAYFTIAHFKNSSLTAGGGILFQYQLKNNSTVTTASGTGNATTPSAKSGDKFGLYPVVNVLFNMSRIGIGYQMVFLATQLKGYEGQHLEHKVFLQGRLSKK